MPHPPFCVHWTLWYGQCLRFLYQFVILQVISHLYHNHCHLPKRSCLCVPVSNKGIFSLAVHIYLHFHIFIHIFLFHLAPSLIFIHLISCFIVLMFIVRLLTQMFVQVTQFKHSKRLNGKYANEPFNKCLWLLKQEMFFLSFNDKAASTQYIIWSQNSLQIYPSCLIYIEQDSATGSNLAHRRNNRSVTMAGMHTLLHSSYYTTMACDCSFFVPVQNMIKARNVCIKLSRILIK